MESIREFRGSDPTPDAFFRKIGISGRTDVLPRVALRDTLAKFESMAQPRPGEKLPVFSDTELQRLSGIIAREYVSWVARQRELGLRFTYEKGFRETTGYLISKELADSMLREGLLTRLQRLTGQKLTASKVSVVIFGEFKRTVRR